MTYLFNKIVDNQEFPTFWKYFIAIGIYKGKGEKDNPLSYLPIALLSPLSKLIEMELLDQIDKHMTQNNLWNPNSFAYRKLHSTTNALIDMMDIWSDNINCNTQNLNMFIDLSAAFYCVEHNILLSILKLYRFDDNSINLIKSYLSFRSQSIYINGKISKPLWVKHGVP